MAQVGTDDRTKEFFEAVSSSDSVAAKRILSERSVDVNATHPELNDGTALHAAASRGHLDMVRLLIEDHHADVNAKDKIGKAPIHVAASVYRADIVKYLISKGSHHAEDVAHIINEEAVDDLLAAVESGDLGSVAKMIEAGGVDVDSQDKGRHNRTALHFAATKGDEAMVKMLVDRYKADVNVMDDIGELPLHNAADNAHPTIVAYLIEKGSDNAEDVVHLL